MHMKTLAGRSVSVALLLVGGAACGGDTAQQPPIVAKRCGDNSATVVSAYTPEELAQYSDCEILVGRFQQDSVSELSDYAALSKIKKIEGGLHLFRSPGLQTLHGFENLEVVEGDLLINQNWNLTSIEALAKLRTVTGMLYVWENDRLPQAQIDRLGVRVRVGGEKILTGQ